MARPFGTHLTVGIITICLIICTFMTFILLFQIGCIPESIKHKRKLKRSVAILIIVCIITCTLCVYCDLIRWSICAALNKSEVFYPLNQIMSAADLLYYIGTISFYTLAIYRIYISFKDTTYKINICIIRFFVITIIIQSLVAIYYCLIVASQPKEDMNANGFFIKYNSISIIILMTNDFVLNVSLLILFISKLKHALTDQLTSSSIVQIGSSTDTVSSNMVELITRHSLLFGSVIITNQFFFCANILVFSNIGFTSFKLHFIAFCCRSLENTAKILVLFLGLKGNLKYYKKICGKCHTKLALCVVKTTQKKVDMNRRELYQYQKMEDDDTKMVASISGK